eukprot:TRINITY_DN26103_c2_g2_i3.p1 TRINITY_DN26103_c2_g2~~TRINITY_DN26103_c2_g2_i3.p1  ORF type:complete len:313 (-),score=6.74 TRINITY_DN26103_c2_g2_i3:168-1106(-)
MPPPPILPAVWGSGVVHALMLPSPVFPDIERATQRLTALGLEFDLQHSRFRMSEAWVAKVRDSHDIRCALAGSCPPRQFFRLCGALVWYMHSCSLPLCFLKAMLSFLRGLGRRIHSGAVLWDATIGVPAATCTETTNAIASLVENDWHRAPEAATTVGWSDASSGAWAAIYEDAGLDTQGERVCYGVFSDTGIHIFIKELLAALQCVALAAVSDRPRNAGLRLMVDNAAVVSAVNRGPSSNFLANELLCLLFSLARASDMAVHCTWVSTTAQRADAYTRGAVPERAVPPALNTAVRNINTSSRVRQVLATMR